MRPLCRTTAALTLLLAPAAGAQLQLFDSNGDPFDNWSGGTAQLFIGDGSGLALDGDVLAVGGFDDSVSILRFDGATWVDEQELDRSGMPLHQGFGTALALDGGWLAVGSFSADVTTQIDQGSVTLFEHDGSAWVEGQTLTHAGNSGDMFGASVALHDDVLVVGAPYDDGTAITSGRAYVYRWDGSLWSPDGVLDMSGGTFQDAFGYSVAVHDDVIAVGAMLDDIGADFDQGSARVFRHDGLGWVEEDHLEVPTGGPSEFFGWSIEVHDDRLFISEPFADNGLGGVRVYEFDGLGWVEQQRLQASQGTIGEIFGAALDLDGERLVVGAPYRNFGFELQQGAAVVFEHDGSQFVEVLDVTAADGEIGDFYGTSVATHAGRLACGAPGDDHFVDGDIGSVWLYTVDTPWSDEGCALAGVSGDPQLTGAGVLTDGSNNVVALGNAAPNALSGLFLSLASNPVPFKGGTLKPVPFLLPPVVLPTDPSGAWSLPFVMPPAIPTGTELWLQVAIQDAAAVAGMSLSNALLGVTP